MKEERNKENNQAGNMKLIIKERKNGKQNLKE
jgi:hypothetical protein